VRNGCVPIHHFFDNLPDVRETHASIQKCGDSDFVRGIIVDALAEERELALQRRESKARATGREELQIGGGPAS